MTNILHISDIHFGDNFFYKTSRSKVNSEISLAASLKHAVRNLKIDHLVISGDIFDRNNFREIYDTAIEELKNIFEIFDLGPENISIIPGNHDVSWEFDDDQKLKFYNKLCHELGLSDMCANHFPIVKDISENIKIVLLNSNIYENEYYAGLGQAGSSQLLELEKNEELIEFGSKPYNHIFAAFHHHLLPINNESLYNNPDEITSVETDKKAEVKGKLSSTLDSVNVLKTLRKIGASLIMSGHQHQQALYEFKDIGNNLLPLVYSAIGSVGLKNVKYRSFNVYSVGDLSASITNYKNNSVSQTYFEEIKKFDIPLERNLPFKDEEFCTQRLKFENIKSDFKSAEVSKDYSDLFVILLSVVNCEKSREVISTWIDNWNKNNAEDRQIVLKGMYDLLGRYDLYVLFRCSEYTITDSKIYDELRERLIGIGQMDSKGVFSYFKFLNIRRESGNFKDHFKKGKFEYNRITLKDSNEYDFYRIQKGIVYINCGEEYSPDYILKQFLTSRIDEEFGGFINCVYSSEDKIIIEFIAKCSEFMLINRFNKKIAPILADLRVQKYNLLFYHYQEYNERSQPKIEV